MDRETNNINRVTEEETMRQAISKQQRFNEGQADARDDIKYRRNEKHTRGHFDTEYLKGYRVGFYSK